MSFKVRMSTGRAALSSLLVMLLGYAAQNAFSRQSWVLLGVLLALTALPLSMMACELMRVRYSFMPENLQAKGFDGWRRVDLRIPYELILRSSIFRPQYGEGLISVVYWQGSSFSELEISLEKHEDEFMRQLASTARAFEFSHVLAAGYAEWQADSVRVPAEACAAITNLCYNPEQIMALVDDGGRMVLLADCVIEDGDGSDAQIEPGDAGTYQGRYLSCDITQLHRLGYRSAAEALADMDSDASRHGQSVRMIDSLAVRGGQL